MVVTGALDEGTSWIKALRQQRMQYIFRAIATSPNKATGTIAAMAMTFLPGQS